MIRRQPQAASEEHQDGTGKGTLRGLPELTDQPGFQQAFGKLSARFQQWTASDELKSDYCRSALRWFDDECWEESPIAWKRGGDLPDINPFTGEPLGKGDPPLSGGCGTD
jgi:hypothetical protein